MRNIIHKGELAIKSNELISHVDGLKTYRAEVGYSPSFLDRREGWIATQLKENVNGFVVRSSRVSVRFGDKVRIFDKTNKEPIADEEIAVVEQGVDEDRENTIILDDATADTITVADEEKTDGFHIIRTLENGLAWMEITYKIMDGQGIKRTIKYKSKAQRNLRICIKWRDAEIRQKRENNGEIINLTKGELRKRGEPYFVVTHSHFELGDYQKIKLVEDFEELYECGQMGNTEIGIQTNDKVWMNIWTLPKNANAEEEYTINFDETYVNTNPTIDGWVYQKATVVGSGCSSSIDVWFDNVTSNSLYWGQQTALIIGFSYYRTYIQWDITGIPNNSTITLVELRAYGQTVNAVESQIRHQNTAPSDQGTSNKWSDIGGGTLLYSSTTFPIVGSTVWYDLGATAVSTLQAHLSSDRYFIGMKITTENTTKLHQMGSSRNITSNFRPRLRVTYTVPDPTGTEVGECEVGECELG